MIKFVLNLFKNVEDIDKSSVTPILDIPEKAKQELFDDAVKEVVRDKLTKQIELELAKMCYTEEEIEQTEAAIEEFGRYIDDSDERDYRRKKYPKASIRVDSYSYREYLEYYFNVERFIKNLLDKEGL